MPGLTRRKALLGGAGLVLAAGAGSIGRYGLGDEFEEHVADTLGLDLPVTRELLATMREEVGNYEVRASGFVVATTEPWKSLSPGGARREAVESFIGPLIDISQGFVTPYVYLAGRESGRFQACGVLSRR
jgi:hypothetical protein